MEDVTETEEETGAAGRMVDVAAPADDVGQRPTFRDRSARPVGSPDGWSARSPTRTREGRKQVPEPLTCKE